MQKRYLILLSVSVFLFSLTCRTFAKDTINIGVIGAMKYSHGQETWKGATMAADEINKRGGVRVSQKRMKIKLLRADSNESSNVQNAANMMEILCFNNKVDFIVGGFRSEAVMEMQDVAMDYQKIYISVGAALPELCNRVAQNYNRYKYYFRGGTFNSYYLAKGCFLQLHYVAEKLRKELGVKNIRVAIAAEKAGWVDAMIEASKKYFPQMGLELAGVFLSSAVATDVTPEIRAIANSGAELVFTLFSSNVGIAFVSQAADLKLPAFMAGINLEAQRLNFWKLTGGKADYLVSMASYCPNVEINKSTKPFLENYMKRFGQLPTATAESYTAIAITLVPAIEQAGSLDPDLLVSIIENREQETPRGSWVYEKDELGRHLHDIKFGSKYALSLGIQWVDGQMKGIWPNKFIEAPGEQPLTYKGVVDLKIPPLVLTAHKKN